MTKTYLLDPVQILHGSHRPIVKDAVLIRNGQIKAFGQEARNKGATLKLKAKQCSKQLLAPCLVDPHSILEEPLNGNCETLASLRNKAAQTGYGQVALLPRSPSWRDRADRLMGFNNPYSDVLIHLWGSFSKDGKKEELATHGELLQHGAVGIAEDDAIIPIGLLERGFKLGEMGKSPVLLAPRDEDIQRDGLVREGVETLRAGWSPDPLASETIPLSQLLELHNQHPNISIRLMNISTKAGVEMLANSQTKPMASVSWWHLIKDSSSLSNNELGWRVIPSLGRQKDRMALIQGLLEKTLTAVAVHGIPLDEEELKLPTDKRLPGLSGYQLVLPSLWQELVVKLEWKAEQLWEVLSFGPSRMLNQDEERLEIGSQRWLLFDPNKTWRKTLNNRQKTYCANEPLEGEMILGKVIDCGLRNEENQSG